jgi:glycosyltransferase involved in cell wall biosynthesis
MPSNAINLYSPNADPADSYGRLAIELADGLSKRAHVNFWASPGYGVINPALGGLMLGYPILYPNYGTLAQFGKRVALTMFESTILPPQWREILNGCSAVIVPSRWCAEVFAANGVTVPIYTIPLGISAAFQYVERPLDRKPYTFLAIADGGKRKNWEATAFAFVKAFGDDPNYRLILKCREYGIGIRITNSNIEVISESLTDAQMAELYGRADCMVFPTCAEGWGLPPREFAATGGAAIATNWGGTADDIDQWGYPLNSTLTKAWVGHRRKEDLELGEWAQPDRDHLIELMRFVSANREEAHYRGRAAALAVRRLYSWDAFAAGVFEVWEGVQDASDSNAA